MSKAREPRGWISVSDKLPDEMFGKYLVYIHEPTMYKTETPTYDFSYVTRASFDKEQMLWIEDQEGTYNAVLSAVDTKNAYHVTHWMPLPDPPKEGEE